MVGHKIIFYGEIRLIIPKLSLLPLFIRSSVKFILRIDFESKDDVDNEAKTPI